jgi:hypothetical protein
VSEYATAADLRRVLRMVKHETEVPELEALADLMDAGRVRILPEQPEPGLGEEQCCGLACDGGACETCPCCCAGWCVFGNGGLPDEPDDLRRWLDEAAKHNPVVAAALAVAPRTSGGES